MGGKKGGKKGKKASSEESGDDDSTQRLYNAYNKKCVELGTTIPSKVREKFNDRLAECLFLNEVSQLRFTPL